MSYVEGDFLSQTTAYKLFMRGSDDAWHALGVSRIVADGVAEGDFTVEGTLDVSGGLVYVGSSSSYLQESSGDLYLGSGGGATLRLDGTANLAHFYRAVTMASTLGVTGAVDIGSYWLSEDKHVTIKTNSEYDVSYRLFESLENDGTSFAFDGGTNKGSIRRHSNSASGTAVIEWDRDSDGVDITGTLDVSGALSKGSGSFKISHPLPELTDTHHLVHSFTESPQADLLYSGSTALVDGKAQINIDEFHGMTEGTFEVLCRNVRTFSSNETGFHHVRGSVEGSILNLECEDSDCDDTVSWLVIGERKDQHMFDTGWTNDNGEVIVEPLKPEPVPEPVPVQRTVQVPIMAGDKQATKLETVAVAERIEFIDGVATLIPATWDQQLVPQFDTVGIFDTDGNPVYA